MAKKNLTHYAVHVFSIDNENTRLENSHVCTGKTDLDDYFASIIQPWDIVDTQVHREKGIKYYLYAILQTDEVNQVDKTSLMSIVISKV